VQKITFPCILYACGCSDVVFVVAACKNAIHACPHSLHKYPQMESITCESGQDANPLPSTSALSAVAAPPLSSSSVSSAAESSYSSTTTSASPTFNMFLHLPRPPPTQRWCSVKKQVVFVTIPQDPHDLYRRPPFVHRAPVPEGELAVAAEQGSAASTASAIHMPPPPPPSVSDLVVVKAAQEAALLHPALNMSLDSSTFPTKYAQVFCFETHSQLMCV
jgi:hypothetical protein